MLPFFSPFPNQIQAQAPTDPSFQQAAMFNQTQFPTPPAVNFGVPNANLGGFNASNVAAAAAPLPMAPSSFLNCPNVPPMIQSNQSGVLPQHHAQLGAVLNQQLLVLQLLGQSCGVPQSRQQFQGQLQGLNILTALQSGVGPLLANNLPQNSNFIGGVPNGQIGLPNTMLHGNQIGGLNSPASSCFGSNNPALAGNRLMATVGNLNTSFNDAALSTEGKKKSFAHHGKYGSLVNPKQSHQPITRSPMKNHHPAKHMPPGNLRPQVRCFKDDGSDMNSVNSPRKSFTRNLYGQRKTEYKRFQKPQFQNSKSLTNSVRAFNGTGGRVPENWREGKPQFAKCSKPISAEGQRCLRVNYTENEIQQWIGARRKNFPTRANIEKKLARSTINSEDAYADAKLCRRQLKEVLAKQAELGVEVAEIPPGYLSEPENQAGGEANNSRAPNVTGHFSNRYNNKRGRHGREKWQAKRPKLRSDFSTAPALIIKRREPTLLRKLLSSDIKRDQSRLLQVFRFMVLNSFFEHWPEKPLEFPSVTVKDMQCENETAVEKSSLNGMDNVEFEMGKSSLVKEIKGPKESCDADKAKCKSEDWQQ